MPLSAASSAAATADAGAYDFGEFAVPEAGGEYVAIDLSRDLMAIASRLVSKQEPDVAALIAGLQRVRVHVIGVDEANRADLVRRVAEARTALAGAGWLRVVTVRESNEDVDIYVKTRGAELIDGVVVTVLGHDDEAVFINVVGNIKPEQIALLGERFGIDPLKDVGRRTSRGG